MNFKNTVLPVQSMIQSKGRLLDLSSPVVMGIINVTPDSFYSKSRSSGDNVLEVAEKMLSDGATILDIGGASTRPGAKLIAPEEEIRRVVPAIEALREHFPNAWLSIDTYNSFTAKAAIEAGAHIVNDVSSGKVDNNMLSTVSSLNVPYIAMHMQGLPENMQQKPQYDDVVYEIRDELRQVIHSCEDAGIKDIIIDPGFGFGKSKTHNFDLMNGLHTFTTLGKPILAGISRKGMIWKTLGTSPEEALNGTTALHMVALQQGANILRVHDVKEAVEVITLYKELNHDS